MSAWSNFYMLLGTGSATLIGLMFVAITLGSKLITPETQGLARWALSPIFLHFIQVFLVCCVEMMPAETSHPLAYAALATSLLRLCFMPALAMNLVRATKKGHDIVLSDWILSLYIPLVLLALLSFSGFALLSDAPWAYYGVATGLTGLAVSGVFSAWDMLIWIATQV